MIPQPLPSQPPRSRVLVAEDNPVNQEMAREALARFGCHVAVVENGRAAIAAWRSAEYGLVLMDCQMPELDGFEATRTIRAEESASGRPRVPIVALTANAMVSDRDACLAAGMDDFLAKPFRLAKLRSVLAKWLPIAADGSSSPGPAGAAPPAVLDEATLDAIRGLQRPGAPDILGKIIRIYLAQAPKLVGDLSAAVAAMEASSIELAAHSLKSSSANLGATSLADSCQALERCAHAGDLARAAELMTAIETEFSAARRAIEALLATTDQPREARQ